MTTRPRHIAYAVASSATAIAMGAALTAGAGDAAAAAPPHLAAAAVSSATARIPAVTGDARVDKLLTQMTPTEKMTLLSGASEDASTNEYEAGYLPGVPRLGIPSLRLTDGPPGIATRRTSTGMTSTMGVAATFDNALAQENGKVIGRDARALGQDVALEPFINIDRDPTTGRGWNTFGEDPLLTGSTGASEIKGIQSQGVMAQAKHYIAYDGASGNVVVDQQTLHEIYLAPFQDAVDAGVASIMCSYNAVNGPAACGNSTTLQTILRGQLGFKGFVTSDWGANHATDFLAKGLDMEMPGNGLGGVIPQYFSQANLTQALNAGTITEAEINTAVGRILYEYDRFGLLDGKSKHTVTAESITQNATVVKQTGEESAVLLKNTGNALPLSTSALSALALIGPGAGQTIAEGGAGESSTGRADRWIGTVDTLKKAAPNAAITYRPGDDLTGTPVPASALSHDGQPGLLRTTTASGDTAVDDQLNFTTAQGNALPAGSAHTWTGQITAPEDGTYSINFGELGTTGTVSIDGKQVVATDSFITGAPRYGTVKAGDAGPLPTTDGLNNKRASVDLTAGAHDITITQTPDVSGDPVQVHLFWTTPTQAQANHDAAVKAAKNADTAVVFAYADAQGGNLTTPLPDDQDELIEDVAAANPNTIVVLQSNAPVAMPWLSRVKAVLEGWFPGDEGGWSFADLLTGAANPSGRLPFTWPAAASQGVASDPAHPERSSRGVDPGTSTPCTAPSTFGSIPDCETDYSEGVDVGYRWYAAQHETPLFPFGFGLSYARFSYSGLRITSASDGGFNVSVQVKNVGTRAGSTVPQVYLGAPAHKAAGVQFAPVALAGYGRVMLGAGRSTTKTIHVGKRQLEYWSTAGNAWRLATGPRTVRVADSATANGPSSRVTVVAGHLRPSKRPHVTGKPRVGQRLRVSKLTWSVQGVEVRYQWLRNGKAIAHASHATYRVRPADYRTRVSVRITAEKSGYAPGEVTAKGVRVNQRR
ncbi:beta-glucosidase family protein [Nocardioides sp. Iso805N]|uniref:beta-glucosidase family protein n=1 Tax=Nocardioides sp. Iso805N TaxID=1283287 RepID=UPI0003A9671C|nr:glycoside hydrolase family 3 C-terminal domain-containing protein [Nocardioides sp. Iso805N]